MAANKGTWSTAKWILLSSESVSSHAAQWEFIDSTEGANIWFNGVSIGKT
jgi:hypothetical protein